MKLYRDPYSLFEDTISGKLPLNFSVSVPFFWDEFLRMYPTRPLPSQIRDEMDFTLLSVGRIYSLLRRDPEFVDVISDCGLWDYIASVDDYWYEHILVDLGVNYSYVKAYV